MDHSAPFLLYATRALTHLLTIIKTHIVIIEPLQTDFIYVLKQNQTCDYVESSTLFHVFLL